jgi:hypothetical protein
VVEAILGPIIEVDARAEILRPIVHLTDTGEESVRETTDHVGVLEKTRVWRRIHGRCQRWCGDGGCSLQVRDQGVRGMAQPDQ